jgi:hypothetical protein
MRARNDVCVAFPRYVDSYSWQEIGLTSARLVSNFKF